MIVYYLTRKLGKKINCHFLPNSFFLVTELTIDLYMLTVLLLQSGKAVSSTCGNLVAIISVFN